MQPRQMIEDIHVATSFQFVYECAYRRDLTEHYTSWGWCWNQLVSEVSMAGVILEEVIQAITRRPKYGFDEWYDVLEDAAEAYCKKLVETKGTVGEDDLRKLFTGIVQPAYDEQERCDPSDDDEIPTPTPSAPHADEWKYQLVAGDTVVWTNPKTKDHDLLTIKNIVYHDDHVTIDSDKFTRLECFLGELSRPN